MCDDDNLALTLLGDLDGISQVSNTVLNLDLLAQELLEGIDVEDLVADWLRSVDNELLGSLALLLDGGFLHR